MRRIYLLALFMGLACAALAQESNCSDGVDNDGDGFIDCFDGDCANNAACDDSYIGKDKLCQTPPPGTLQFGMKLGASSRDRTSLSYGRMAVGDLDRDGTPEMVTTHNNDKKVYILNGNDLSIKTTINTIGNPEYFDHAIANLDDDNCAEIFIVESEVRRECDSRGRNCVNNTYFMVTSFDCNGNQLWRTQAYDRPFTIGLADFDYDGNVELYYKNEILDAKTGQVLVTGTGDWNTIDSGPVAVDILPDAACAECAGLELVLGGEIYAVDLNPRTPGGGSVGTAIKKFNNLPGLGGIVYFPKYVGFGYVNSMTSVADYNLDGNLDVVMNGATSASATSTTTVFFWDVTNNTFKTFQPKQPNGTSWPHGTGRINLADVDGDGKMNATFVSGARIYSLKEDFTLLWQKTITEQTSGFTSTTVFDFNNDNAVEIVYRDEANLYIIDGKTGNAFTTVTCKSRTANDYPIVVDVDADGATEICVSCATNNNTDISDNNNTPFGQIRTYKSSLEPWVSARKVWNQYAYFNVNVNDDLTIPQVQQKHHLVFSTGVCGTGQNRALNSFLNQSAILDSKGCKTYPSADVAFLANPSLLNITPPTCPDKDFLVSFTLQNIGDLDLNGNFPISFYSGDPRLAGATKLKTHTITFNNFKIGTQLTVSDIPVTGTGGTFTLFAVLNDNGSTTPTPITLPNSGFDECNFSNNIVSMTVNPKAFQLTTSSTDHVQCGAGPSPPNGSVKAFKPEGAVEQTVGYTFYWFNGTTAGAPGSANYTGSQVTNLLNGTYTVYARNNAFQCGSDTVQVVVGTQAVSIGATVNVDKPYTNCNSPDGQLSVTPDAGALTDYSYEWFEGTVFGTSPTLSNNNVLQFTKALTYSVLVTQLSSGCETLESGTVPDQTITPTVTTAVLPANCSPVNSGQASANVGGVTAGYTFYWYDGSTSKPTEDFLGNPYSSITAGNYTVIAKDNTTGCQSNETVVTVPTVSGITVTANIMAQQTSCVTPNGAASANVGGATAGFTFRWFQGNNTITQIGNNPAITGLAAGDYTVEATNNVTGCKDTELVTIVDNILIPTVTPSLVSNQLKCFPADGAVSATAAGSPGGYKFYWFNGNVGTPDTTLAAFKGVTYSGLAAGFYTVVAVDVNTRCGSARGLIQVLDQTVAPVITSTTTGQTSCDVATPNGGASANVGGATAGFKFRWFSGADTTTFITQNPVLSNRAAGTYTVKAVNRATGCFTTKLVVINDISAKPTLSLTKQDNTICSGAIGFTGSVTAAFATNPNVQAGHTFIYEWRKNGAIIAGQTGSSISGLNTGTYEVTVRNQMLGCISDPVSIVVNDVVALPALTTTSTASTNCTPALANGSAAVVTVDGFAVAGTTDYTYRWHTGAGTGSPIPLGPNPTADDAVLTKVQGGAAFNYTVLVTNVLTGCANTAMVNVADAKILPALNLTATDNSVCDPALTSPAVTFNGTVTAAVTNMVGAVTDYNFTFGGGAGVQGVSPAHNTFNQLNGGITYNATATHTLTGCVSPAATVQVLNNQNLPDITTANVGSKNCTPGLEDGQATVVTVDGAAATTTGFTFAWTGPAGFPVAANPTRNAITLANVQGGAGFDYTVLVTNRSNGCTNTAVVNVADVKVLPTLNLAATDNSVCDPALTNPAVTFNGTVTAAVTNMVGALTDYNFTFGGGAGVQGVSPAHNTFNQLNGGITYNATTTHTLTGCVSAPATVQVLNNQNLPDITTANVGSKNCIPGLEDGQASVVTVDGAAATTTGFTFAWTGPAGFSVATNPTRNAITLANVQGGPAFDYTVLVTNRSNGCTNTAVVNVADVKVLPALSLAATDNSVCDPALTNPAVTFNGGVTATVTNMVGALTDYNFTFGGGAGVQGVSPVHNTFTQLNGGITYNATTTHTLTGCVSAPATVQVLNNQNIPDITTANAASTNCVAGLEDGQARVVTVDGAAATTTGFTFAWTGPAGFPVAANPTRNAILLDNVQGGAGFDYGVLVTNLSNGCANTAVVNVADAKVLPTLSLAATDNSVCTPGLTSPPVSYNGTVTATVTNMIGVLTDYNFAFGGAAGVQGATPAHNTFNQLNGGITYNATATHTLTGCVSAPATVQVLNNQNIPDITTSSVGSTNCVAGLEDGQAIVATVDGAAATTTGFTFAWTGAIFNVAGNPTNNAIILDNIQGGAGQNYTVLVTNQSNGCQNTAVVGVADQKILPALTLAAVNNTICDPASMVPVGAYNGSVTASVSNLVGAVTDYTFNFVGGAGVQGISPNHNQFNQLNGGITYTATTTHTLTGCVSGPANIQVQNVLDIPDLTTSSVASTNCAAGLENGQASVLTVDTNPATTTGFSFAWTGAVFSVAGNVTNDDIVLTNIQGGAGQNYTVLVTNQSNGCKNTAVVNVADAKELPALSLTAVPNTICDPAKATLGGGAYDGQVSAAINAVGKYATSVVGDFNFTWNTGLTGVAQNVLSNLDVGSYTVTAVHVATGCTTAPTSAQVASAQQLPIITMTSTPSQNCPGGAPDGVATVTNVVPNGKNYDYRWFNGSSIAGVAGPTLLNTTNTTDLYNNVQGGVNGAGLFEYTVEITILQTGCVNTATVGVADDSEVPVLGPLTATDNTLCSVAKNGTATITTLSYRGAAVAAANYGDYDFVWSGGTQGPAETITGLPAGPYTLTVKNIADNCTSNPVSVTVDDDFFFPQIDVVSVDQTSCDPLTPNGSLTATVDETAIGGPVGVIPGYTFTWVDNVTSTSTVSNAITNLKGNQNYTVTVVRNLTQCTSTQGVFLSETLTIPVVAVSVTDMSVCAPPNGELSATNLAGHSYYWYDGSDAANEQAVITGADFTGGFLYAGLHPGDYTLVVQDNTTKCVSQQVISTVGDASPAINPTVANTIIPADCNVSGGTLDAAVQSLNTTFSALAATNELTTSSPMTGLLVGDQVIIGRNGALAIPIGLEEDKVYFIESINATFDVITLSATLGGPQIDITVDGDGTIGDFKTGGYSYEWFPGVPSPTNPALGSINYFTNPPVFGGSMAATSTLMNIGTGIYTVEVTDPATGCKNYLSHTLPFIGSHAVIKINKTNSNICPATLGNGSIEIQIENPVGAPPGTDQNSYQTTLFRGGANIVGPYSPGVGFEVIPFVVSNSLAPDSYIVEVRETYSGLNCAISQEVIIGADALAPVISLTNAITSNTACDVTAFDGQIDITVSKDPNDLTGAGVTYDILMLPDPNAAFPLNAQPVGNYSAVDLGPGAYQFTVNASNGCTSTKSFSVLDKPTKAQFAGANLTITSAEYCDINLEQSAKVVVNQLNIIGGGAENLADYRFDWFTDAGLTNNIFTAPGDPTAVKGGEELSNVAPLPSQRITNGAYWVVATKINDASATGGIGCSSAPYSLNINSNKILPVISMTPFGDTSCDPAVFEGSLQVDVTTASGPGTAALYDYTWAPTGAAGQPANSIGNTGAANVFNSINDGTYQLTALNQLTGCNTVLSTTILKQAPPAFTVDAVASNLTNCAAFDGRIDGLQVFVDGAAGNVADFDYVWFKSDLLPASKVLDGQNGAVPLDTELTLATYPGITFDKYFVKAIRKAGGAGTGCESPALRRDILDARIYPQLSFATVSTTACDNNHDGQITVTATTASGPGAASNYNFVWTNDPDGLAGPLFSAANSATNNTPSPFVTATTDLIGEGSYTIRVTNFTTQCFTDGTVAVTKQTVRTEIVSVTPTHVDVCLPSPVNGAGTVTAVNVSGAPGNTADFTYTWDDDQLMGTPFVTNNPALTQGGLDVGTYYVIGRRNAVNSPATPGVTGSGCVTSPVPFTVLDKRVNPTVSFATISPTACDNNHDGQITVTATTASGPGAASNYNFVWTNDPDGLAGPLFSAANSATNNTPSPFVTATTDLIGEGSYTIRVTNFTTQCFTDGTVAVTKQTVPTEIVSVTPTHVDVCLPSPVNGAGTVTAVNVSGAPGNTADFTYTWDDDQLMGTPFATNDPALTQGGLDVGTYYVIGRRNAVNSPATPGVTGSGCVTSPVPFTVLDKRVNPTVSFATISPTACDNNHDGQITVTATTASGPGAASNYNFVWTNDPDGLAGPLFSAANSATNNTPSPFVTATTDLIGEGSYTIRVTNFTTQCFTDGTVAVTKQTVPTEIVSVTPTHVDVCLPTPVNGAGTVTAVNVSGAPGNTADFTYTWDDDQLMGTPFATNDPALTQGGLDVGTYYVIGKRNAVNSPATPGVTGSGCVTPPVPFTVLDKRVTPTLSFATISPTACDNNHDGQITVTATTASGPGAASNYNFVWTNDPDGLAGPLFSAANSATNNTPSPFVTATTDLIGEGSYTIRVTNFTTQCFTDGTVAVTKQTVPTEIVSVTPTHVDVCLPTPVNGAGTVTAVNVSGAPGNTADFTYTWDDDQLMGTPFATNDPALTQGGLDVGTYYVIGRRNAVNSPVTPGVTGSGCVTSPVPFTVLDKRVYPTITFATLESTSCNNEFDGQITVTATSPGFNPATTNYDFVWTSTPGGSVVISNQLATLSAPVFQSEALGGPVGERIGPGSYNITVTNTLNMCPTLGTVTLQQNTVPVEILTATANPQQMCTIPGDGSVAVALADVRVNGNPVVGGITFAWEDDNGNPVGAGTSVTNLDAGFYAVQATRTSGLTPASGCVSAPLVVEVRDDRQYPVLTFSTVANTTCNNTFDGSITVNATTTGIGAASNYSIVWNGNPGGAVVIANNPNTPSPYTTLATDNIGVGIYTATVTNLATQCPSTGSVTVLQNTTPVQIWDVTKVDQRDCAPFDGSITIDTNDPNHVSVLGPYTFTWDKGGVALAPVPDNVLAGVDGGVYTVTGTKTSGVGAGCVTNPFSVTLLDLTEKPVLELFSQANFACDPAMANGQLSAIIFEGTTPAPAADYNLQWFAGKNNTTPPVLGNADILANQVQGDYTLLALDNVSPNRGCSNTATLAIDFEYTSFSVAVAKSDQNLCSPLQNGSVSVTGITEVRNGVSTPTGNLALYAYQWVDAAGVAHPTTPTFTNGATAINNLLAGQYMVQVRNPLGCISTQTAGIVNDLTVLPVIALDNFLNPAICILPETEGSLQVSADNSLNFSDYIFEWFEGPDDTGTLVEPNNATLANIQYNEPLQYTVRVTNIATNCRNLDTYRFSVDTVQVQVLASAVGRVNCLVDDGTLFATTINGTGALYNYEWYAGPTATGTPVYTTKQVTGAPIGQYTVIAVNPTHAFCKSTEYTIDVGDERVYPAVVAIQKNPLTYCDPANPNGVAFASVNNEVNGFVFDWFQNAVGATPMFTGPEATGLTATTYVVRATDIITGCDNTASILIENDPVNVKEPTVVILSHLTNCVVPDGALEASVDGNTADYLLQWYNGNTVRSAADQTGEFYRDLDKGLYTTTATDNESGCVSDPVVTEILPFQEEPDFDIVTVPTNCEQNIGEATLVLKNDVQIFTVEWNIGGDLQFGTMLSDLPKGEFTVIATTYQQCKAEKTFTIEPEVLVFNGISRNNDGRNDYFEIACIQDFPQNNVKIFNRAGTLVYEANGYDNQDVFFDGVSNRGINLLGTDLPDGTYFYIIDKRNGSAPRTGYLELLK